MRRQYTEFTQKTKSTPTPICRDYIHFACNENRCKYFHPKNVMLCKDYFSEKGCKNKTKCTYSHKIKIVVPVSILCFTVKHVSHYDWNMHDYIYTKIENYYTKDGESFYDNKECIARKYGDIYLGYITRFGIMDNYISLRDSPILKVLKMIEEYKIFYMSFMIISKLDLVYDVRNVILGLFLEVCDLKYYKKNFKSIQYIKY